MLSLIHSLEPSKVIVVLLTACLLVFVQAKWNAVPVEETCFDDIVDGPFESSQNTVVLEAEAEIDTQLMVAEILPKSSKHSAIVHVAGFFPQKLLYPFQVLWRVPQLFHVRRVFIPQTKDDMLPSIWDGQLDVELSDDQAWETGGSILSPPLILSPAVNDAGDVRLDYFALSPAIEASTQPRVDYFGAFGTNFVLRHPQAQVCVEEPERTVFYAQSDVEQRQLLKTPSLTNIAAASLDRFLITGYGAWAECETSLEILSADAGTSSGELAMYRKLRALEEEFPCMKDL